MPVAERETAGQVLRGFCPVESCGAVTKRKDFAGRWVSKCAHPGANYEGRMVPGGGKKKPIIPDSVDRGILPGIDPRHGALEPAEPDPGVQGMVDAAEPREGEKPRPVPAAKRAPAPTANDPAGFDARAALQTIANAGRGLAGALVDAQRMIRDYEGTIARASLEIGSLRDRVAELEAELASVRVGTQHADIEDDCDREVEDEDVDFGIDGEGTL